MIQALELLVYAALSHCLTGAMAVGGYVVGRSQQKPEAKLDLAPRDFAFSDAHLPFSDAHFSQPRTSDVHDCFYECDDVQNVNIDRIRPIISPAVLAEECPMSPFVYLTVKEAREEVKKCLHGPDDRVMVVVGPCSIHDPIAALDYAKRLVKLKEELRDDLLILMRVYFEKPRTTIGWKGLINDPEMDGSHNIKKGIRLARQVLLQINELGLPCGCEFLDTVSPQYLADLVAWGAIGARTTESQVHRELTSGLSMPVGFKNGTSGDIQIAADAVKAAKFPHSFLSVTSQGNVAIVNTKGNQNCHLILRGGEKGTNYDR
jgi:3-deoxy-7-phosphoheptulonate synthase